MPIGIPLPDPGAFFRILVLESTTCGEPSPGLLHQSLALPRIRTHNGARRCGAVPTHTQATTGRSTWATNSIEIVGYAGGHKVWEEMESAEVSGIVKGLIVGIVAEILAHRFVEPYFDRFQNRLSGRWRPRNKTKLVTEGRLVDDLRLDPARLYRYSLIHLFSALLSFSICGLFLLLGFFTGFEIRVGNALSLTNAVAIAVSAVGALFFVVIGFDKLLDGLTMLRRIDNYDDWAVYVDEELRKG